MGNIRKRIYKDIKIYSKDTYKDDYKEPKIGDMLFSLTDITNSNVQLLTNWFSKEENKRNANENNICMEFI